MGNQKNIIVLVEPTFGHDKKHAHGGHNEFEPLGLEYIQAVLLEKGHDVKLIRQMSSDTFVFSNYILSYSPDIVCFSVLTYNYSESIAIASKLKSLSANIKIIFGGYHASIDSNGVVADDGIDFAVIGEGERTIVELVEAISKDLNDYSDIDGIVFKTGANEVIITNRRDRIKNLDELPFPTRSEEILKHCKIYGLMTPPPSKQTGTAMVACSRGCPYHCEFCCSNSVWGHGVTHRTPDNVIGELESISNSYHSNAIFFSDLTFNSNNKWAIDFCKKLINIGPEFKWYCMCTIRGINEELIQYMSLAGCKKIGFGIETLNIEKSQEIKTFTQPSLDAMNNVFDLCNDNGIFTKAYLMIGFPDETQDSLIRYIDTVKELRVDEIKVSFYTPFPGTKAHIKFKERLRYKDYGYYDTLNHVVIRNEMLSEDDYFKLRKRMINEFYGSEQYRERVLKNINKEPSLKGTYKEFITFLSLKDEYFSLWGLND